MSRSTLLRSVISALVVAASLWFVFRSVDLAELWNTARSVPLWAIGVSISFVLASHVLRASRWLTLLKPTHPEVKLSEAFSAIMVGYAASTVIPRSGELIRPWTFARRSNIPVATALSSVVIERVLDVLVLLIGMTAVLVLERTRVATAFPWFTAQTIITAMVLPMTVLMVFIIAVVFTAPGTRLVTGLASRISAKLGESVSAMLVSVRDGLTALQRPSLYARLTSETILLWALYTAPLYLLLNVMDFSGPLSFTMIDAGVLLVIIAVGVTIAPTPGALGVYQGFAQQALMLLYGATPEEGLAFAVVAWLVNYGSALVVGGAFALRNRS
jgi:uncharacterized protein (TIRG00374 family)